MALGDYVFDATHDGQWYGSIDRGVEAAIAAGKDFILWNDRIYVITWKKGWYDTGKTRADWGREE